MKKVKRSEWLSNVIKKHGFKIGAEIGCLIGGTTEFILRREPRLKLYAVDLWEFREGVFCEREYNIRKDEDQELNYRRFLKKITLHKKRVTILRGVSWEMADKVEDESLDFVFIDADHGYESVKKDIVSWYTKVKKGGLISGHDINLPGVLQAVTELLPEYREAGIDNVWYIWKNEI